MSLIDSPSSHYGSFATWLRDNPDTQLPANVAELCRLSGCTSNSVRQYLRRRRRHLEARLNDLPPLRMKLLDVDGQWLRTAEAGHYTFHLDFFASSFQILFPTPGRIVAVRDIEKFLQAASGHKET